MWPEFPGLKERLSGIVMGLHDREYYREEPTSSGFQLRKPTSVVIWLIIINLVVYAAIMFTTSNQPGVGYVSQVNEVLKLEGDALVKPWKLYGLATYGFAHACPGSPTGILHVLMNMYGLFLFGRDVERKYGRAEFLSFYVAALLLSGIGWLLFETIFTLGEGPVHGAIGASGAVVAVTILYCINFPKHTLYLLGLIAVPAWLVGLMFVGFDLMNALGIGRSNIAWQAHLAGAAVAAVYAWSGIRITAITGGRNPFAVFKRKPSLKIHNPGDDGDNEKSYHELDNKADELLEKISRDGEDSLTAAERKILEDYARRMRQKHR